MTREGRFRRLGVIALMAALAMGASSNAAPSDALSKWFGSQTCPALDGLYSKKEVPYVKTGFETLEVDVPKEVALAQKPSMTVPWYVYDPRSGAALSHIGGDCCVVWTLRVVKGAPPVPSRKSI